MSKCRDVTRSTRFV